MKKYAVVRFLDEETPLWSDFERDYLAYARVLMAASTIKSGVMSALKHFRQHIKNGRIGEYSRHNASQWVALLSQEMKPNTVRHKAAIISAMFSYALQMSLISENPFQFVEVPKPHYAGRNLSADELRRFLIAMPPRFRRACILSLYSGMRRGEIVALQWEWIAGDQLTIPGSVTKSKKGRVIYLNKMAMGALGPRGSGRVFDFSGERLDRVIKKVYEGLGIGRIRFHDMRHTWASKYMERSPDLFALMAAGGWASTSSALPYQHVTAERQRKNMSMLSFGV